LDGLVTWPIHREGLRWERAHDDNESWLQARRGLLRGEVPVSVEHGQDLEEAYLDAPHRIDVVEERKIHDGREASSHPQSDAQGAPDVVVIKAGRIEESEAHQSTAQGTPQLDLTASMFEPPCSGELCVESLET
jgi:hypothetical protein